MRTLGDLAKRDAKFFLLMAALGVWAIFKNVIFFGSAGAILFIAAATLLWKRQKAGIYLGFVTLLLPGVWFAWQISSKGLTMGRAALIAMVILSLRWHWQSYRDILRGRATWDDPEDEGERTLVRKQRDEGHDDKEAGQDKPMTSIVLLRRTPKPLDDKILLEIVRDAWDENRKLTEEELFVAGTGLFFIVRSPQGMWMVHNHPRPYFEESPAPKMAELRLRKAIEDHTAWLSVDLMQGFMGDLPTDVYYPYIFRLIRELADDDTLAIFRPETGEINIWSDEVARSLGSIDPLEEFATPVHSPVISVSDEDPRMKAAIEEARRTFPTFREHWATRGPEDSFLVKSPIRDDHNSEVIWIEVTGLEPEYVHGTLANEPVNVEGHRMGDRMEVPVTDLYDWAIARQGADGPLGLFTEKVVFAVQKEARETMGKSGPDSAPASS